MTLLTETAYASDTGSVKDEATGITVLKIAGLLDDDLETKITLSFPGAEDHLGSDIVFVLDKSGASDWSGVYAKAKEFLDYVKAQADENGLKVKIGVVLFNYKGNVELPLSDISTSYDEIVDAMGSSVQHGTNMHAGLLAGKKMLDDDTEVAASRKHLVLISDGATYLYCKDDDYTTCYSRSFGDPTLQTNPETGEQYSHGVDWHGGIWEYLSRDYNVTYAADGSEGMAFYNAIKDPVALGTYLDLKRQQGAEAFDEYDFAYGYDNGQTIPYANRTNLIPISKTAVANIDKAFVLADDTFQAIADEGYNTYVYFQNTADFDGHVFLQYLVRNTNSYQLNTDFADLEDAVVNLISAGSAVDDQIGEDFDFVNDVSKISLKIGDDMLQAVKLSNNKYGFGTPTAGVYPFILTYNESGEESLHLEINQTVSASAPVTMTYCEKLVNVPTQPGTYQFSTNESAVLNCVDSMGSTVGTILFPVPMVTYTVPDIGVNNNETDKMAGDKISHVPETGDGQNALWCAVALLAAAAALTGAAVARKRSR